MNRRLAAMCLVVGAMLPLGSCLQAQQAPEAQEPAPAVPDRYVELVKEDGSFRETWVLPGVDASRYHKVFVWDGEFDYRDVGPARKTRSTLLRTHKREFGISEQDRRKFEEIVGDAFLKEIAKGKQFQLIDSIDDVDESTLILRGGLLDIISRVPPETVGRSEIYLASIGAATFVMELIDARSGDVVALVAERRSIDTMNARSGGFMMQTNSVTILGDIRRWASTLARRLRTAIDEAIEESAS